MSRFPFEIVYISEGEKPYIISDDDSPLPHRIHRSLHHLCLAGGEHKGLDGKMSDGQKVLLTIYSVYWFLILASHFFVHMQAWGWLILWLTPVFLTILYIFIHIILARYCDISWDEIWFDVKRLDIFD